MFSKIFLNLLKKEEKKNCNSESTEDFRKVQWQIYSKIAKVSLKPFSSENYFIEAYIDHFKDLKPMH